MENYKYIQDKLNNGKIVILDGANGSEYGLKLTGGGDQSHFDGLSATFDASQPAYISYYVKPQITRAINTNYLVYFFE